VPKQVSKETSKPVSNETYTQCEHTFPVEINALPPPTLHHMHVNSGKHPLFETVWKGNTFPEDPCCPRARQLSLCLSTCVSLKERGEREREREKEGERGRKSGSLLGAMLQTDRNSQASEPWHVYYVSSL
jgi:hypothetical protein